MTGFRIQRINKELQKEISLLLELKVKDEAVKAAVITEVDCNRDLSLAKVYFTTLHSDERGKVTGALKRVSTFLRTSLGKTLRIRKIPKLIFLYDKSEEYGRSIDSILDQIIVEGALVNNDETEE